MEESLEIWPNRLFGKYSSSYTEPKPKQTKEQCVCVFVSLYVGWENLCVLKLIVSVWKIYSGWTGSSS